MAVASVKFPRKRWIRRLIFVGAPSIFLLAAVIFPFFRMITGEFGYPSFSQILGSGPVGELTRRAIYNSLIQGGVSALFSFIVGLPLGIFMGKFRFRFKRLLTSVIIVPFFLPSIIVVFAFMSGFGAKSPINSSPLLSFMSSGFTGIIAVNTFFNAPLVALFTMTAIEQSDAALNEAAITLNAGHLRRFITIWGRDGLLAGTGGALLAFTYSFAGFAAPLIIGGPRFFTMDAWIYFMVKTLGNLNAAVTLALIEALILMIPALTYAFFSLKQKRVAGTSVRVPENPGRGDLYFIAGAVFTALWIGFEIYLLSSVFVASFTMGSNSFGIQNYRLLFGGRVSASIGISSGGAIMNSLFYGLVTSLSVVSLGLVWITGKRRSAYGSGILTEFMNYVPLIISSIILAFAISEVFGMITPVSLVWVLIIVAQTSVAIPVVLRVIDAGFSSIPRTYTEASLTLGGNPFFEVELPLARTTFASAVMFGFAISLGEFSATNFIATANYISLTVEMYMLQGIRLIGASYAAAVILLVLSLGAFYIIQRLGERFVGFR